jgi:hypothetical protein
LAVNTNKFTVTAASGDTAVAGTLSAVGDFAINTNKFTVTAASGNVSSAGTLNVAGNLNVNTSKFNVVASTGNTSISGTLTVADTVDFASTGAMRIPRGTAGQRPAGDTGMLRFNTNTQSFEGHNGVAWGAIGGSGGVGTSQYVRQTFVATAGQTSFTVTGGYTPDSVDVFQNGVKLVNGSGNDVTITSGTVVVLATGAAAGDVIDVIGLASGNFAGPATAKRQNFTATAGQTVFTVTGGYTPNQLDVFQNGTKLVTSVDVDVSNGSTFTLTTPAVLGDNLEVVGFTAANTIAGTLKFQAGTAAAPSITRFENENTGIFFPATDTIAFSDGGVEAMRINSSGNVGIGNSNPSSLVDILKDQNATTRVVLKNSTSGTGANVLLRMDTNTAEALTLRATCSSYSASGSIPADGAIISTAGTGGLSIDSAVIRAYTSSTERLRIDSSGNVGIGVTSRSLDGKMTVLMDGSTNASGITIKAVNDSGAGSQPALCFANGSGNAIAKIIGDNGTGYLAIQTGTSNTERLRIDSSGNVSIGGTPSPNNNLVTIQNTSTTGYGVSIIANSSSATYRYFEGYSSSATAQKIAIYTNGDVKNTTGVFAAFSDIKLKKDIVDAESQWNDIKALRVRKYRLINDETESLQIGLIAQEVEQVSPRLVNESFDEIKNNDGEIVLTGEVTKGVKYSILYMKAVKALQEAMVRIETLEAKVTALEAA